MATRGKSDLQTAIKETLNEVFLNDEFMNQIVKRISDKVEQKLNHLQIEVDKQITRIDILEQKIDGIKQHEKINNICIYGLPEENDENINKKVLQLINKHTGLDFKMDYIATSYRIGNQSNAENKFRPIILRLTNHDYKIQLLKNAKKFKGKKLFIAEDLTKYRRELLTMAKSMFGEKNAWTFNGQIYTKLNGHTVKIRNQNDIMQYKK